MPRTLHASPFTPLLLLLAVGIVLCVPQQLAAQSIEPPENALRLGPVSFAPVLELRSLGYDSNVFNEDVNPRGDVSGTFLPSAEYFVRMGPARLSGQTDVAFVYFQQFERQRSVDFAQDIKLALPMNRVTAYVMATLLNTRQRPGLDIDLRARRLQTNVIVGLDVRVGGKTTIGAFGSTSQETFANAELVDGVSLREQLTRRSASVAAQISHALTPLTSLSLVSEVQRQTFSYDPTRDSDSIRIAPRVDFKPSALIRGSAVVGYRKVRPDVPIVEPFSGPVAAVDLTYTFRGTTQVAVAADRDLVYSYRPIYPYYVLTAATVAFRQQLSSTWEFHATAGRQLLDYRQRLDDPAAAGTATGSALSKGYVYGGGIGQRLGRSSRINVDFVWSRRDAGSVGRDFEGWRSGLSMLYGF